MLSKKLTAPLDKVWDIVGDLDREPEFWHGIKSIRNICKVIVSREMWSLHLRIPCREIVQLDPKKGINTEILSGTFKGTKTLTLTSMDSDATSITVNWEIELSGFYKLFSAIVRNHIHKGTEEALERISKELEGDQ